MLGGKTTKEINSMCTSIVVRYEREKLGWLMTAVYNVHIKCIDSSPQSFRESCKHPKYPLSVFTMCLAHC